MGLRRILLAFVLVSSLSFAQGPVISPRGVINAVTFQPAPSQIPLGGLVLIQGFNLGPANALTASGTPLPTMLGDTEVLIAGKNAPLFSVTQTQIMAQVPWDLLGPNQPGGLTQVVVRRSSGTSPAALFRLVQTLPAIETLNSMGYGPAGSINGSALSLSAVGLGTPQPAVTNGYVGSTDTPSTPSGTIKATVGGLPANVTATLSTKRVGEYDVTVALPADAQPGDLIALSDGTQASTHRVPFQSIGTPQVFFTPLPKGSPALTALRSADLRGSFLVGTGARGNDGCSAGVLFDLMQSAAAAIPSCFLSAAGNPITAPTESDSLASLLGPATGTQQAGLTTQLAIFQPAQGGNPPNAITVTLPAAVSTLAGFNGSLVAIGAGTPPAFYSIDVQTGTVSTGGGFGGFPGAGGAGPGGGGGGGGGIAFIGGPGGASIDLGDGVTSLLGIVTGLSQGTTGVIAADDANKPTKAKFGIIGANGTVKGSVSFPDSWLPLLAPQPATTGGQGGGGGGGFPGFPGGGAGGAGGGFAAAFRVASTYDAPTGTVFIASRKTDSSADAVVAVQVSGLSASAIPLPSGWYVTSCRAMGGSSWFLPIELSRSIALLGSVTAESTIKNPCTAQGYLLLDPDQQQISALTLPGAGQANVQGSNGDVNDYLYLTNSDASAPTVSDTLFVLDGISQNAIRFDLPKGVATFSNLQAITELNALVGVATNTVTGDAGIVYFDLGQGVATVYPVPDGFQSVTLLAGGGSSGYFAGTRKFVVRGTQTGNAGSNYIIYDLITGDSTVVANPQGVAFVAQLPTASGGGGTGGGGGGFPGGPPGGGGFPPGGPGAGTGGGTAAAAVAESVSANSNFVAAIGYGADQKPVGVVAVRVP